MHDLALVQQYLILPARTWAKRATKTQPDPESPPESRTATRIFLDFSDVAFEINSVYDLTYAGHCLLQVKVLNVRLCWAEGGASLQNATVLTSIMVHGYRICHTKTAVWTFRNSFSKVFWSVDHRCQ